MSSCEIIQQRIQEKRNNLPLPIGGVRCIMFWYDSKKDFIDCIDGLHIIAGYDKREVKIHKVESFFETKYLLEHTDTQSHYIIYIPHVHPDKYHENWLIDIELYASEFKADNLAMAMDECGIESMEWYGKLEDHVHFFGSQERKQLLHDLFLASKQQNNIESLYTCMLAVCVGSKRDTFDDIVINLFKQGFEETNKAWTLIKKSKLEEKFWQQVKEYYDYKNPEPSLTNLWYSMYFGAIAYQQSESSLLRHYVEYTKNIDTTQAFHTLDYWMKRSDFNDIYSKIIDVVENSKDISSRINELNIDELKERRNITISPLYEKLALRYCKQNLGLSANQAKINDCMGYRKIHSIRYKMFEYDYGIVENVLGLMTLLENVQIEQKSVNDMRSYYEKIARKIDYTYRNALYMYDMSKHQPNWQDILETTNSSYSTWVRNINSRRYDLLKSEGYCEDWNKGKQSKQRNFRQDCVAKNTGPDSSYGKAIVIISDALRYEVAQQLKEQLQTELRGDTNLQAMFGVVPSFTQLGMASLLPYKDIEFSDLIKNQTVKVDSISTAGLDSRKKILAGQGERITAIKREDFSLLKTKEEQIPFMTNYDIVYIYHNVIDTGGEKDEHGIPKSSQECIDDLIKIIKKCGDSFNFTQIFVTADHGFLYQRDKILATDKTRRVSSDDVLQESSRFALLQKGEKKPENNDLQISLSYLKDASLMMSTPRSDMRYQKQGSTKHFAHGGATLQEVMVPILSYYHKKSTSTVQTTFNTYTEISLISPKMITTNEIILNVFQTTPLVDRMRAGNYKISIANSAGEEVSNSIIFKAESTESQPEQRMSKVTLSLSSRTFSKSDNYAINIKAELQDNNNYTQSYPVKISIGITDDFF